MVTQCDDAYWSARSAEGRPADHRDRQIRNAQDAIAVSDSNWLAHLDADEFLEADDPVGVTLGQLPDDILSAHMTNVERVFVFGRAPAAIFDGMSRRQLRSRPALARLGANVLSGLFWYGRSGAFMTRGMIGYVGGRVSSGLPRRATSKSTSRPALSPPSSWPVSASCISTG